MGLSRSQNMARIKGRDTTPERTLREALWAAGLRYRLHFRTPGGRADIAVPGQRLAVFIDGCFWHGCPEHYVRPRSRNDFWDKKLAENIARDRRQTLKLESAGWSICRIWEHEVIEAVDAAARRILQVARQESEGFEPIWRVTRVEILDDAGEFERRHLEDLRDPAAVRIVERRRSTRKIGRVPNL